MLRLNPEWTRLLDDYKAQHQDPRNQACHRIGIPMIMASLPLGATIVGAHAGDLLAEFVLAMRHGLGLRKILGTIHSYPTMMEANKYAAGAWRRAHQPARLLQWVSRFHAWRRS